MGIVDISGIPINIGDKVLLIHKFITNKQAFLKYSDITNDIDDEDDQLMDDTTFDNYLDSYEKTYYKTRPKKKIQNKNPHLLDEEELSRYIDIYDPNIQPIGNKYELTEEEQARYNEIKQYRNKKDKSEFLKKYEELLKKDKNKNLETVDSDNKLELSSKESFEFDPGDKIQIMKGIDAEFNITDKESYNGGPIVGTVIQIEDLQTKKQEDLESLSKSIKILTDAINTEKESVIINDILTDNVEITFYEDQIEDELYKRKKQINSLKKSNRSNDSQFAYIRREDTKGINLNIRLQIKNILEVLNSKIESLTTSNNSIYFINITPIQVQHTIKELRQQLQIPKFVNDNEVVTYYPFAVFKSLGLDSFLSESNVTNSNNNTEDTTNENDNNTSFKKLNLTEVLNIQYYEYLTRVINKIIKEYDPNLKKLINLVLYPPKLRVVDKNTVGLSRAREEKFKKVVIKAMSILRNNNIVTPSFSLPDYVEFCRNPVDSSEYVKMDTKDIPYLISILETIYKNLTYLDGFEYVDTEDLSKISNIIDSISKISMDINFWFLKKEGQILNKLLNN